MNEIDELNLIQNAEELYTNPAFRKISKSNIFHNRFLLHYYIREYAEEKVVFTIDFNPLNQVTILDWYRVIWSKKIKDKLINYFKLLGFEVNI